MFFYVSGNGEANKKFKTIDGQIVMKFVNRPIPDEFDKPAGRQKIFIQAANKVSNEAQAVIYLEGREPQWVRVGTQHYKDLWDFLGYCDISEEKIVYKNDRNTKWIVEPDCIKLLPRGRRDTPPLAVFNSVCIGDPGARIMIEVLYIADDLRGLGQFEILAGFFLMEYLRKRVFVIKTQSISQYGDGALNCWPKFKDLLIPSRARGNQYNPNAKTFKKKQPRKLKRTHDTQRVPLPPNKKIAPPVDVNDRIVVAIMSKRDRDDPFAA